MAMGVPVVATPQAAKGIQAIPQKHLLVGDDAESFADQVVHVLENPTLQKRLSEAGRKRVEETHAWSVSMQILDGILQNAVAATGGSTVQGLAASIPGLAH
jgi:glycosyltransferase involved in cell wall biosynthesis